MVSNPEKILHRRNWREKQIVHTDIRRFSLEESPSSTELDEVQGPETTARVLEYSSDNPFLDNVEVKDEAKSVDTSSFF